MKIVLFGLGYHPYTLDVIKALKENDHNSLILIEFRPKYSIKQIEDSPDIDIEFLKSVHLRTLISLWSIKLLIKNPVHGIRIAKKLFSAKKNIKFTQKDPLDDVKTFMVKNHNDKNCKKILNELQPDLIILCPASSIIKKNILDTPKIGVINAHMGLLPKYRGMNALEWTLFHEKKAYITVHFVEEDLDMGDIIKVYNFPVLEKLSIDDLKVIARIKMAQGLADVVKIIKFAEYSRTKQEIKDGKQYFYMHKKLQDFVELLIKKSNENFKKNLMR